MRSRLSVAVRFCGLLISVSRLDAFDAFLGLVRSIPAKYGSLEQDVSSTATLEKAARNAALASDDAALLRSIEALEEKAPVLTSELVDHYLTT